MALSTFALLYIHYRHPFPEIFIMQHLTGSIKFITAHILPFHLPLAASILLCLSMNLTTLPYMSGIILYLLFCDWRISFSIVSSKFSYTVVSVRISFLFSANILLYVYTIFCLFVHQWILGLLLPFVYCEKCCCCVLGVQIFLWDSAFSSFRYILRSGIVGSYGNFKF